MVSLYLRAVALVTLLATATAGPITARNGAVSGPGDNDGSAKVSLVIDERGTEVPWVPVTIGGQTLRLRPDINRPEIRVYSKRVNLPSDANITTFNPNKSNSFEKLDDLSWNETFSESFAQGGRVGADSVRVGDTTTVDRQAISLYDFVSPPLVDAELVDGSLGLSREAFASTIEPLKQLSFWQNVKSSLSTFVFTADIRAKIGGTIDFGYIDKAKYRGKISYTPVTDDEEFYGGFWEVTASGYQIGDGAFSPAADDTLLALDASLIYLKDKVVKDYWAQVEGSSTEDQVAYTFPCAEELPDLTIGFGAYRARIPGQLLRGQNVDDQTCEGALFSQGDQPLALLGAPFFKAQFVVFDGGRDRVGFAAKA